MKYYVSLLFLIANLISCKESIEPKIIPDGQIGISQLENKKDYIFPITIYNDVGGQIYINESLVQFSNGSYELPYSGFFRIMCQDDNKRIISINLLDAERGDTEWGLKKWVPVKPALKNLSVEQVVVHYPFNAVNGINIPFVFFVQKNNSLSDVNSSGVYTEMYREFLIKNGVGSINLEINNSGNYSFNIGGKQINRFINVRESTYTTLSGKITQDVIIPEDSLAVINEDLEISINGSLTFEKGSIVLISPKATIRNNGSITFSGSKEKPILVTSKVKDDYWGGFVSSGSDAKIEAQHSFFCYSGYHEGGEFNIGHAKRQALFQTTNSTLNLSNCYILDNIGQVFYPVNSTLYLDSLLVQRAKTGGQFNYSNASISNCIFTDFPSDNHIYQDDDNDGLYINASNVSIQNSIFMYAKDDGLDSGGNEGGVVTIENCHFESCFHEGAALSTQEPHSRTHEFINCTFKNNGQGLELGFSSSQHHVYIENCLFENNHIGIRYGDNYGWGQKGYMHVSNSVSINNDRDVWNMLRSSWQPLIDHMIFDNTFVSKKSYQYPDLEIYSTK